MQNSQNNYGPLNYCFDLKKSFCLTACSQVYNEIILDGNHTRMDESECWSECTHFDEHSFAKNYQKLLWGLIFFKRILMNYNKTQWNIRKFYHMLNKSLFLSVYPLENEITLTWTYLLKHSGWAETCMFFDNELIPWHQPSPCVLTSNMTECFWE